LENKFSTLYQRKMPQKGHLFFYAEREGLLALLVIPEGEVKLSIAAAMQLTIFFSQFRSNQFGSLFKQKLPQMGQLTICAEREGFEPPDL
jgi:hypothetical protein